MNDTIKKLYQFAVFFNVFVFLLYLLTAENILNIPVYFKIGGVKVSYDLINERCYNII